MKNKNLIMKIALGASIASQAFSIANLIRAIIYGNGIPMACFLVVATAIVVLVCVLMLRSPKGGDPDEDDVMDEDDEEEEADEDDQEEEPVEDEGDRETADDPHEKTIEQEIDAIIADLEKDSSYDLSKFE